MNKLHQLATGLAAMAMLAAMPAHAEGASSAEKLRRLDIMLMVTGLRCRATEDNFQADFQAFEARHMGELNAANRELRDEFAARMGPAGADAALDRLSVTMANQYGNGHPWLGCHELKSVARDLADSEGSAPLIAAADELLGGDAGPQLAYARR